MLALGPISAVLEGVKYCRNGGDVYEQIRLARQPPVHSWNIRAFALSATYRKRDEDILWSRFVGKVGRDIAYDLALLDDGIVVVGWTSSQKAPYDQNVMIVKLSKN